MLLIGSFHLLGVSDGGIIGLVFAGVAACVAFFTAGVKSVDWILTGIEKRKALRIALYGDDDSEMEGIFHTVKKMGESMDTMVDTMKEMAGDVKSASKLADRANRTAIAAHRRLDQSGIPRSWGIGGRTQGGK